MTIVIHQMTNVIHQMTIGIRVMAISTAKLRLRGYSTDDIALARLQQEASRRAGGAMRSLGEVLAGEPARPRSAAPPDELTARQLRRRGRYGQAALLADQAALQEADPERAVQARYHAVGLKALARKSDQIEFDLLGGGNVSLGNQYIDAVQARLMATKATPAERDAALATLLLVVRHLIWQSYTCEKTAADLAELRGVKRQNMAETLALLESVGALGRVKRGRTKVITVTPEGAFRGRIDNHAAVVDRYKAEVVQLRPELAEETP